jgi:amino acid permease
VTNPFDWDYLTAPVSQTDTFGPFSIIYLVLFTFVFIASAFMYVDSRKRFAGHKVKRDVLNVGTQIMMWISAIGLIFFGIRAMGFPFLSFERRIWMYLTFLVFLGTIGYFIYYMQTVYPAKIAAFERERERRRYIPQSGRSRRSSRAEQPRKRKTAR